jgi:hypothetical protein
MKSRVVSAHFLRAQKLTLSAQSEYSGNTTISSYLIFFIEREFCGAAELRDTAAEHSGA